MVIRIPLLLLQFVLERKNLNMSISILKTYSLSRSASLFNLKIPGIHYSHKKMIQQSKN